MKMIDGVAKASVATGILVAGGGWMALDVAPASAAPASAFVVGNGNCVARSDLKNNAYPANLNTSRWQLGNFPHGSVHTSDADMPGWSGYTGANTHVYLNYKSGGQYSCRWVDFTSYAGSSPEAYHCLAVSGNYKGRASRPYTPDPHPSAATVDISEAALESYWCD